MSAELVLGTAQLGMDYGIANRFGQPTEQNALDILRRAYECGIRTYDTAPGYGDGKSESLIGGLLGNYLGGLSVITKLPSLQTQMRERLADRIDNCVERSLVRSLTRLGRKTVKYYLLHDEADLIAFRDELSRVIQNQKHEGRLRRFGVSVYSPDIARLALELKEIEVLQIPVNAFDRRFETIAQEGKQAGMTIFARSIFLQGLLFLSPFEAEAKVPGAGQHVRRLRAVAQDVRRSVAELSLCFVRDNPNIDGIVVGVDTLDHLEENVGLMSRPLIPEGVRREIRSVFSNLSETIVNPTYW